MAATKLGIDARLLGVQARGLGRYTQSLIDALIQSWPSGWRLSLFIHPSNSLRTYYEQQGIEVIDAPWRPYSWGEQFIFPKLIKAAGLDLVHFPHFNVPLFYRARYVVTVHDLILHHYPSRQISTRPSVVFWSKYVLYRLSLRSVLKRAAGVMTVSAFSAEDLLTYYPWLGKKLGVITEPCPEFNGEPDEQDKIWYNIHRPYLVVVGSFYPHKNLANVLTAWAALRGSHPYELVLVGPNDAFAARLRDQAKALGLLSGGAGAVRFISSPTDERLERLYRDAAFCLCPSLYEGAGLPGLEALHYGTAVISSAAAALPETYGRAAQYIPVTRPDLLRGALVRLLMSKGERGPMDLPPVRPTYKQFADAVINFYKRTLA